MIMSLPIQEIRRATTSNLRGSAQTRRLIQKSQVQRNQSKRAEMPVPVTRKQAESPLGTEPESLPSKWEGYRKQSDKSYRSLNTCDHKVLEKREGTNYWVIFPNLVWLYVTYPSWHLPCHLKRKQHANITCKNWYWPRQRWFPIFCNG